jgi:hypothetical protein
MGFFVDFDPYMIVSAHQLVSEAIIMDKPQTDDAPSEEVEEASVEKETGRNAYSCHDRSPEGFSMPRTISNQPRIL